MFTRMIMGILCFMAIGCAPEENPDIEYFAVLSNRSAEYNMYNEGTTSKLPTYWGTVTDHGEASRNANSRYDSWANKMWVPEGWDQEAEIIWEDEVIEVLKNDAAHQAEVNDLNSSIKSSDLIISDLSTQIEVENSCTLNGKTLKHNESTLAYTKSSVAYNRSCPAPQSRLCLYGVLQGEETARHTSCAPKEPRSCQFVTQNEWYQNGRDYLEHGQSMELWPNPIESYTCSGKSIRRTCTDGVYSIPSRFPHSEYQREEYYIYSTCSVPLRGNRSERTTESVKRSSCPTISEYNKINTHNYPNEFKRCTTMCFDRTGYFGSLLPESHPHYINAPTEKRESCFQCEMGIFDSKCYYPRDQFYIFKYSQEIDPKETFNIGI